MNPPKILGFAYVDWSTGTPVGSNVRESVKTLGQMRGFFQNQNDIERMNLNAVIYRVQWLTPVPEGTEAGLFWGTTVIEAGRVGDEYYMTHGHFHAKADRAGD